MNFFQRLMNRLLAEPKPHESRVRSFGRTTARVYVSPDTALQNATVWACITYLGRTVGQLPWRVMQEMAAGGSVRVPTHPVDKLLSQRPNPELPPLAFRETLTGWAATWGNGIAEIVRDGRGLAVEMWPIHPSRVVFDRDADGKLVYDIQNETGAPKRLYGMDVFHVRGYGDGSVGLNVVAYAAESIGWARATELFGAAYFGDGMNPSGIVEIPGKLTTGALAQLRDSFKALYTGGGKREQTVFLDQAMKWTPVSRAPEEGQFVETRQHQVEEICRWFGVPPHKAMHLLRSTFSNIEHQSIEVVVDSITPWVKRFEEEANYKLFGPVNRSGMFTKMDLKGLLRGDFKSRAEGYRILRDMGVMSVNEIRSLEDMNPIGDEGDKRIVPLNMTTLERIGEEPAKAEPAAPPQEPAPGEASPQDLQNSAYVQALATAIIRHAEIAARAMHTPLRQTHEPESTHHE